MRVLIFGASGYLGTALAAAYPKAATPSLDIADGAAVAQILDAERPDVVINAAGRSGHPNVDWCEDHRTETLHSNVIGPLVLLEQCQRRGTYWVHLGTGCVYQGDKGGQGFSEQDPPNFHGSFYVRTKAWCEEILSHFPILVLRLRMPFDGRDHPRNLIRKLSGYPRLLDVPNSLTCLPDFVSAAKKLIERRCSGIFHVVNPGAISPLEVMQSYRRIVDPAHTADSISVAQLRRITRAPRSNCVLNIDKLRAAGIDLPDVRQSLDRALGEYAMNTGRRAPH